MLLSLVILVLFVHLLDKSSREYIFILVLFHEKFIATGSVFHVSLEKKLLEMLRMGFQMGLEFRNTERGNKGWLPAQD